MDNRAIAFFDSGIGGLTTLIETKSILENEKYIYYADDKNVPYGSKGFAEIEILTENAVKKLLEFDVKAIVLACNTATRVCAEKLRQKYSHVDIFGLEPAIKPAHAHGGKIAVLATPATIKTDGFLRLIAKYGENANVLPLEDLAMDIENSIFSSKLSTVAEKLLKKINTQNYDSIVLGCTHYIFLRDIISTLCPNIRLFDGNHGLAVNLFGSLMKKDMLSYVQNGDISIISTSGSGDRYSQILKNFKKITKICQ